MKVNFVVGVTAEGKQKCLYLGEDGGRAKKEYSAAVNGHHDGIVKAALFIRPVFTRRHDVVAPEAESCSCDICKEAAAAKIEDPVAIATENFQEALAEQEARLAAEEGDKPKKKGKAGRKN